MVITNMGVYLYGASGHAKVIMDILQSNNVRVDALIDDDVNKTELQGVPVLHSVVNDADLIISIGDNWIRKDIAERTNANYITAVHSSAIVSSSAIIRDGSVVMQGAIIQADVIVGKHCIVNTAATIDHDCILEDYVHISPNASLCGNVSIGEGTQIGAGSVVVPGVKIGKWSLICAGSVVTKDIPDNCVAGGNRCEIIRYMKDNKNQRGGGRKSLIFKCFSLHSDLFNNFNYAA